MKYVFAVLTLSAMLQSALPVRATDVGGNARLASAVISPAVHFNRIAGELGLPNNDIARVPQKGTAKVTYWAAESRVTRNYAAGRGMIVRHIDNLVPALSARMRRQEARKAWLRSSMSKTIGSPCA
ncbi:MAG TPA: hypothetical protein VNZ53_25750 [Steroidobacteraceae bacterium]|jgi:hypothetical protein|nr:hypothetical protein [Steroidobacteraceae bacterium]